MQALALSAPAYIEYVPAAHATHASSKTAAVDSRNLPAAHSTHGASPTESLKVPAAHAVHLLPLRPAYPTKHLQSVTESLAIGATAFVGHTEHSRVPSAAAYVSAAHIAHRPPGSP
jgi:hypothetical protein